MWCNLHNETEQNNWVNFANSTISIFHFLFIHVDIYTLGYYLDKNYLDCHCGDTNDRFGLDGIHNVFSSSR